MAAAVAVNYCRQTRLKPYQSQSMELQV